MVPNTCLLFAKPWFLGLLPLLLKNTVVYGRIPSSFMVHEGGANFLMGNRYPKMALYPKKNAHFQGEDDHQMSNLGLARLVFCTNGGNKLLQTTERNISWMSQEFLLKGHRTKTSRQKTQPFYTIFVLAACCCSWRSAYAILQNRYNLQKPPGALA